MAIRSRKVMARLSAAACARAPWVPIDSANSIAIATAIAVRLLRIMLPPANSKFARRRGSDLLRERMQNLVKYIRAIRHALQMGELSAAVIVDGVVLHLRTICDLQLNRRRG